MACVRADAPLEYFHHDRDARHARRLFSSTPAVERAPLVAMELVVIRAPEKRLRSGATGVQRHGVGSTVIVHTNIYPGVGRLKIRRALADLIGGKLHENRSVLDVAFTRTRCAASPSAARFASRDGRSMLPGRLPLAHPQGEP